MAMGMSYDEFWFGDPDAARMYRKAYRLKADIKNYDAWLQGLYVYEAIGAWTPLLRAFSKATKPGEYPKEPHGTKHKDPEEVHKKSDDMFNAYMTAWMSRVNKKFEKGGGASG